MHTPTDEHASTGAVDSPAQRRDAVLRFTERFAVALADIGLPRMPARVFAYVLIDDADRYTAAELSEALQVSPAAISGAVRMLSQMRLLGREREPGARVDTYRIYDDDLWGTITLQRQQMIPPFEKLAADGVELLGAHTPGGRRMRETQEFYAFWRQKILELHAQWQEHRRRTIGEPAGTSNDDAGA